MEERLTAAGGELAAEVRAGVATVTLNRPSALNALSLGIFRIHAYPKPIVAVMDGIVMGGGGAGTMNSAA